MTLWKIVCANDTGSSKRRSGIIHPLLNIPYLELKMTSAITVTLKIEVSDVTGPNPKPVPASFTYKATFEPSKFTVVTTEHNYTSTNYSVGVADVIVSDVLSLMPDAALAATPSQIIEGRQSDYPDGFVKRIGFSDIRLFEENGLQHQTVTETFFIDRGKARSGTGASAQAMTPDEVSQLLQVGGKTDFFIFHRVYDVAQTRTTYEGTATIVDVSPAV
jgi:hypothetical protein